jgi:hypothetical protein
MITPDKILTYWILVWYILYMFKIVHINPKFPLIMGLFINIIMLMIIIRVSDPVNIFYFLIIVSITKIIPILTLWNSQIHTVDIYYTFGVVFIYLLWLYVTDSMYNPITALVQSVKSYKPTNPGMYLLHYLFDKYLYKNPPNIPSS